MYLTDHQEQILQDALNKWGEDAQIDMCIEECSELIQALCKYKRGKHNAISNIKEELADVFITIKQMQMTFEGKSTGSIQGHIDFKVNRLKERVESC